MELSETKKRLLEGTEMKLVALGDSLTQGWMVRKGYLDFFGEMLAQRYPQCSITIINRGQPGDTADGGLHRLRSCVIDMDPDLVFIQFALNDAFIGIPPERFANTIEIIIEEIKNGTEAEILLITSVPIINERENRVAEVFYERLISLSEKKQVPVARVHSYWQKKIAEGVRFDTLIQYDQVHPNIEGHRLMAEAIMEHFN